MLRFRSTGARAIALVLAVGCVARVPPPDPSQKPFRFPEDVFAFRNETVWQYDVDPATGSIAWHERDPPPAFSLRCATLARVARQFWANARFDPDVPAVDADTYARLVQDVIDSDRRGRSPTRVVIPGYADLHSFSAAHEALVKRALAGPWQSHMQRGNWRMIFPFRPVQQRDEAERLRASVAAGWPPIVHVFRYPRITLNHFVLFYAVEQTPTELRFLAYDPNDAEQPIVVSYDRAARAFDYAATPYFPGGPVKAYEAYDGLLY